MKAMFCIFLQQGKKTEISTKISQVRNGVADFTAHIEAMRSTRDLKLADMERIQKELQVSTHRPLAGYGLPPPPPGGIL